MSTQGTRAQINQPHGPAVDSFTVKETSPSNLISTTLMNYRKRARVRNVVKQLKTKQIHTKCPYSA